MRCSIAGSFAALAHLAVGCLAQPAAEIPWHMACLEPDACCQWRPDGAQALTTNGFYYAGPSEDQTWDEWYAALLAERDAFRQRSNDPESAHLAVSYDGVRAWIRGAMGWVAAADPVPGGAVRVEMEARWIEGADELCLAFDFIDRASVPTAAWRGWSGVAATGAIPTDGEWHPLSIETTVPDFDYTTLVARPILGMDGTYRAEPAVIELRRVRWFVPLTDALSEWLAAPLPAPGFDDSLYRRRDLRWMASNFVCGFLFLYDRRVVDPRTGRIRVDELLDDAEREFGGYDSVVLWQAYPRIGADERNQFDFFREMPGGLEALRAAVQRFHARRVRVFIPYNPWDVGTHRESVSDAQALADLVGAIEADGIFLDTMLATSPGLREAADAVRPGVAFEPEGQPPAMEMQSCSGSWAQWFPSYPEIGVLRLKWLEQRHMQHQIRRWNERHTEELQAAWLNGSGIMVWENVFGSPNPWYPGDRAFLRRAAPIARRFAGHFSEGTWRPLVEPTHPSVKASEWERDGVRLWTLVNLAPEPLDEPLLAVEPRGDRFFDLWSGRELAPKMESDRALLAPSIDRLGAILALPPQRVTGDLLRFVRERSTAAGRPVPGPDDEWMRLRPVTEPLPPPLVFGWNARRAEAAGLLPVEGTERAFRIEHQRRECGCYPDPDVPLSQWSQYTSGTPFDGAILHRFTARVESLWTMPRCVTNAEFQAFLDATGYRPKVGAGFLRHWGGERCPEGLLDESVVYVDLTDARAYAAWARMRLPTELEWHHAAEILGESFERGRVWEWTESERDDGWNRFVMVRGGSAFRAEGSGWYFPGGQQPIETHAKFLLLWPSLDRCSTIGFRCVAPRMG